MTQGEFNDLVVVLTVESTALAGVLFVALLRRGWQNYLIAALLGAAAAVIVQPAMMRDMAAPSLLGSYAFSLVVSVGGMALAMLMAEGLLEEKWFGFLRDDARRDLVPENWLDMGRPERLPGRAIVRRWFIAITAATGAVIGAIFGIEAFRDAAWEELLSQFSPDSRSLIVALLLPVGLSLFLAEPLQNYVFDVGSRRTSEPGEKLAEILERGFTWQVAGRIGFILLGWAQVALLATSIQAGIESGDVRLVATMVAAGATPCVVTYYWTAALQREARSILDTTLGSALFAGAIMNYGTALVLIFSFAIGQFEVGGDNRSAGIMFLFSPAIAILMAMIISAVVTVPYALAGGFVMDRWRGRYVIVPVALALLAAAFVHQAIVTGFAWLSGIALGQIGYATFVGSICGWIAGLAISGFPRLLVAQGGPSPADAPIHGA